jgi:hypothetical protein
MGMDLMISPAFKLMNELEQLSKLDQLISFSLSLPVIFIQLSSLEVVT